METYKGDAAATLAEDLHKKQRKLSEPMTNSGVGVQTTQQVNVAQDITTMSEHDLISYINPSCFDQGK